MDVFELINERDRMCKSFCNSCGNCPAEKGEHCMALKLDEETVHNRDEEALITEPERRKIMTSEQYRTYLTESIKIGAQMMHDMAEDIAGRSDLISNLKVIIEFDPEMRSIPELTIERSHLPNQEQLNRLMDIRQPVLSETTD